MTIDELKRQEPKLLSSSISRLKQYGLAYKEIIRKAKQFSGLWLSDEMLLSEIAKKFIDSEKKESQFAKDKSTYEARIAAAAQLVRNDVLSYDSTYKAIESLDLTKNDLEFEKVRELIKNKYYYPKISPAVLSSVIEDLKRQLDDAG